MGLLIKAKKVLGNIYFIDGNYQNAIAPYQKSLDLAISMQDDLGVTIAWNNLTNTWSILEQDYQSQLSRIQNNPQKVAHLKQLSQEAHLASLDASSQALDSSKN